MLWWFDRLDRTALRAIPPHNPVEHGVFAIRSPDRHRLDPVASALAGLLEVDGRLLPERGPDALDGTPVIDIKVYSPEIDSVGEK